MPRPIVAKIHRQALTHNLQRVRAARPDARLWSVVKADAYGHGIENVFEALHATDGFALLEVSEAERLRRLGWRGPILMLEGVFDARDLEACSRLGIWHAVHCDEQIDWLAALKTDKPHHVFLKMNSGMNRLGFKPAQYRTAYRRLESLPQVGEIGLMMHFSDADGPRGVAYQMEAFDTVAKDLPGERCLCNSAASLAHAEVASDWCRPGIVLYGSSFDYPAHSAADWGLQPAQTLESHIIATQTLAAGDTVGYGSIFTAPGHMRTGIVACGYADGYPRVAPTGTPALVDGVRTRTIGRVSMDMLEVDLTDIPAAGIGSTVTLWGTAANGAQLSVDEVAQSAGTLGYELMCAVAPRVPRVMVD